MENKSVRYMEKYFFKLMRSANNRHATENKEVLL